MLNRLKLEIKKILPSSVKYVIKRALMFIDFNILPTSVRLEASTICQLNCKACYMRLDNYGTVGKGYLKFSDFKRFVDNNKFIKHIELSNSGEIFLNPDLLEIIKYAHTKNVLVSAGNGVNFNNVSDEMLESLVKYKFRFITFSIDGSNQEVYQKYRVNGNFNKVIENIKKLQYYKSKYNSRYPLLQWQYIIMEGNDSENDIMNLKKIAKEIDVKICFKFTWETNYKPANPEFIKQETGLKYWDKEEAINIMNPTSYEGMLCYQLWHEPQINYDGRLLGCCTVYKDDFGVNVFEVGLKKALKSKNFVYAQKMLLGKVPPPADKTHIPCAKCEYYQKMLKDGKLGKF